MAGNVVKVQRFETYPKHGASHNLVHAYVPAGTVRSGGYMLAGKLPQLAAFASNSSLLHVWASRFVHNTAVAEGAVYGMKQAFSINNTSGHAMLLSSLHLRNLADSDTSPGT